MTICCWQQVIVTITTIKLFFFQSYSNTKSTSNSTTDSTLSSFPKGNLIIPIALIFVILLSIGLTIFCMSKVYLLCLKTEPNLFVKTVMAKRKEKQRLNREHLKLSGKWNCVSTRQSLCQRTKYKRKFLLLSSIQMKKIKIRN